MLTPLAPLRVRAQFLRLLTGAEAPLSGEAVLGDHSVVTNYFAQNQAEALDSGRTVLGTLEHAAGEDMSAGDMKSLLGKMGFKGDAQHKKVAFLSGGEKARLALAKFMVTPASLLLLDEPTNHLDIPSKEMLEEALAAFDGTVLAVSHDRYFLRKIATRVLELRDGAMQDYSGDYECACRARGACKRRANACVKCGMLRCMVRLTQHCPGRLPV